MCEMFGPAGGVLGAHLNCLNIVSSCSTAGRSSSCKKRVVVVCQCVIVMSLHEYRDKVRDGFHSIGNYLRSSLAIKNAEDNGPTIRDPATTDLLCDGEK